MLKFKKCCKVITLLLTMFFSFISLKAESVTIKEFIQANSDVRILEVINDSIAPWEIHGEDSLCVNKGNKTLTITFESDSITRIVFDKIYSRVYRYIDEKSYSSSLTWNGLNCIGYCLPPGKHTLSLRSYATSSTQLNYITKLGIKVVSSDAQIEEIFETKSGLDVTIINDSLYPWVHRGLDTLEYLYGSANGQISIIYNTNYVTRVYSGSSTYTTLFLDGSNMNSDESRYLKPGEHLISLTATKSSASRRNLSLKKIGNPADAVQYIKSHSEVDVVVENDSLKPWILLGEDSLYNTFTSGAVLSFSFETDYITKFKFARSSYVNFLLDGKTLKNGTYILPGKHTIVFTSSSFGAFVNGFSLDIVCKYTDVTSLINANSDVKIDILNDSLKPWIVLGQDSLYNPFVSEVTLSLSFETESVIQFSYDVSSAVTLLLDGANLRNNTYIPVGKHTIILNSTSTNAYLKGFTLRKVGSGKEVKNIINGNSDVEIDVVNDSLNPWFVLGQDSIYNPFASGATLTLSFESEYATKFSYSLLSGINITLNGNALKKDAYISAGSHTITLKSTSTVSVLKDLSLKKVDNTVDIKEMIQANSDVKILEVKNNTEDPWLIVGKDSLSMSGTGLGEGLLYITYESDAHVYFECSQRNKVYIFLDDIELHSSNKSFYLPSGNHTLTIKKTSTTQKSSIYGLSFTAMSKNSDIESMIEANSDVDVTITNDSICPWIILGTDSLYNYKSINSSVSRTLAIEFTSEYITSLNYIKSDCAFYVNGEPCYNSNNYIPAGKNVIYLKSSSSSNYVAGLSIKKVCSDTDIEEMIENNSDVNIAFENDSLHPWYIVGQDSLANIKTNYNNAKTFLTIAYQSDSITKFSFKSIYSSSTSIIIDQDSSVLCNYGRVVYLTPGEHVITLISTEKNDIIRGLSIKNIGIDADIKMLVEQNSDVTVEVINDDKYPWVVMGSDSIICQSIYRQQKDSSILTIRYSSDKMTTINFKGHSVQGQYSLRIFVDGEKVTYSYSAEESGYVICKPGAHTIQFKDFNVVSQYSDKKAVLTGLSIKEVNALSPITTSFSYPQTKDAYYDFDGDGVMEWNVNGGIYGVDWTNIKEVNCGSGIVGSRVNLNNDEWIDSYGSLVMYKGCADYAFLKYTLETMPQNTGGRYYIPFDYNNDGYPDAVFYYNSDDIDNDFAYTLLNDTALIKTVKVQTISEYNEDSENQSARKQIKAIVAEETANASNTKPQQRAVAQLGSSALSYNNVVKPNYKPSYNAMPPFNFDLNGDGVEDYFANGNIYTNMGDGTIVYQEISPNVDFVELNNDGILDIVSFDGANIIVYNMQQDGTLTEQKIYAGIQYSTLWAYDFDKDNDKDVLLAFNYSTQLGGSYLILLENNGAGQYSGHEYFYAGSYDFGYCVDYDSDGKYEIIAFEGPDGSKYYKEEGVLCSFEIDGVNISETPIYFTMKASAGNSSEGTRKFSVFDVNNDGILEVSSSSRKDESEHYMLLSDIANERPEQPKSPSVIYEQSTGLLSITWEQGKDKESSSVDLTYALRIGTESGKGDIVYAHALSDGTRRNYLGGNQNSNRYRVLNTDTWKPGKYYISIQVVDPNNRGSLFSEEIVFEKTTHASAFDLFYKTPFGIGDTCTIYLHNNTLLDSTHQLLCEDATIVERSDDGSIYKVIFSQAGKKSISLFAENAKGVLSNVNKKHIIVESFSAGQKVSQKVYLAVDFDEDGSMEHYLYGTTEGYYTYDENGKSVKINKMWNNHAYTLDHEALHFDVNKDGKVDIFSFGGVVLNNGNKNMVINTNSTASIAKDSYFHADFNNDGYMDYISYTSGDVFNTSYYTLFANSGDYETYEDYYIGLGHKATQKLYSIKDYNKDGLVDLLVSESEKLVDGTYAYHYIVLQNNGDFTFTQADTLWSGRSLNLLEDFDNDGLLDAMYTLSYSETGTGQSETYIEWGGDGSITHLGYVYSISQVPLLDFNNDGYLDFSVQDGWKSSIYNILTILPDRTYQLVMGVKDDTHTAFIMPNGNLHLGDRVMCTSNTRPSAPTNISVSQSTAGVMIMWEHSQDEETPACRMRYNISVKHKGKTGEGSYLISPCNSTKNGVHVPTTLPLIESNRLFIPTASIPVGEYEVQVQGVDLHQWESDFSEVFNLIVSETVAIIAPIVTGVGVETTVIVENNVVADINWDGGEVVDTIGNKYIVVWDSIGVKTITMGDYIQSIVVEPLPDASFALPTEVMQLATINCVAKNPRSGYWTISTDGETFVSCLESDIFEIITFNRDTIQLRFNEVGTYTLRRIIVGEFGNGVCEQVVTVTDEIISPEILSVTNVDGHYQILWNKKLNVSENVIGYRLYKETSYANDYAIVADFDLTDTVYIDLSSNPNVQSSRYALSYLTTYGESVKCTSHQGLHVMINKGVGNTWNLAWMKYEGREVSQYRIWRGSTPDNMSVIGTISGNMTSFSDVMTADSVNYYAVEVIFVEKLQAQVKSRRYTQRSSSNTSFSNIVSTASAYDVSFVESIDVRGKDIVADENITSQLTAYIYPYYASYKIVNWVIVEGDDFADIDANGLLSVDGKTNGNVVVRAYALDGSNVYGEITIDVSGFKDSYTVTYIVDDEIWQEQTYKIGVPIVLLEEPVKEGYTFSGWSDVPDNMPANDLKVFGNFVVNTYTITYFVDEEIYAVDSVLYGDTITLLKEPIKQGYKFSGWSEVPVVMPAYDIEIYGSFSIVVFSDFIESDVKINNIKKVLINGVIYILVNDEIYTIYGTKVNFNLEEVKNIKF